VTVSGSASPTGAEAADTHRPVRVVMVDDHPLLTHAMAFTLRSRGVACTIPPLDDRTSLVAEVHALRPDVILLDLDLGGAVGDGSTLVPELARHGATVLVVSASRDDEQIGRALMGGAVAVIPKDRPLDELVDAVLAAARGDWVTDAAARAELIARAREAMRRRTSLQGPLTTLSTREADVLRGLIRGSAVRDIAEAAFVSEATVRSQVRSVLTKLGVRSQLEAVAMAARAGWS
jgi:two-component system nitrate/nitrite response regulator NarL